MKCVKCGTEYMSRECPNCNKIISDEIINRYIKPKSKISKNLIIILSLIVGIATIGTLISSINTNPLIGEWKATKSSILGMNKLKFTSKRMETMGIVSKVDYEIENNEVIVTDETGTGMIFKIIDKDTVYSEIMGIKTTYKKVN